MIADRIRFLRQKNNWSQTELADKLRLTRSSVNAWELGISSPSTSTIIQLTSLFHVSADYLLEINDNPDIINLEQFNELEKDIIRKLLDYFSDNRGPGT